MLSLWYAENMPPVDNSFADRNLLQDNLVGLSTLSQRTVPTVAVASALTWRPILQTVDLADCNVGQAKRVRMANALLALPQNPVLITRTSAVLALAMAAQIRLVAVVLPDHVLCLMEQEVV
jgi:hypothetical protein